MSRSATKTKILDAAERLFAERGFTETSLRQITSDADVNLASVNYHFGSKKSLIQAVLARYLERFMPLFDGELECLLAQAEQPSLRAVFEAFVSPLIALDSYREGGANTFMQLLGRGYTDSQGHLRWFLTSHYGAVLDKFSAAVRKAYPELSPVDFFWRMHFVLGTVIFTMASSNALRDISKTDFAEELNIEGVIHKVIPFLAGGVGAPVDGQLGIIHSITHLREKP